jgi:hypothetical protein
MRRGWQAPPVRARTAASQKRAGSVPAKGAAHFHRPVTQLFHVVRAQPRGRVDPRVGLQWHLPAPDAPADLDQRIAPRLGIAGAPFREVQVLARLVHVVHEQPRYRRDVSVGWPLGLVAVTVSAGSVEDRLHVRRHRRRAFERGSRIEGRIRPLNRDELNRKKQETDRRENRSGCAGMHIEILLNGRNASIGAGSRRARSVRRWPAGVHLHEQALGNL